MPNINSWSPFPFEHTKCRGVELNKSGEEIATSIDLYNYKEGRLYLPISISYQGGGVKVDQSASGLVLSGT